MAPMTHGNLGGHGNNDRQTHKLTKSLGANAAMTPEKRASKRPSAISMNDAETAFASHGLKCFNKAPNVSELTIGFTKLNWLLSFHQ